MEQRRLGGAQAQLGSLGSDLQHGQPVGGVGVVGRPGESENALPQLLQLCRQGLGLVVEIAVDMASWAGHGADRVDRPLDHPERQAALEQHERGADRAQEGGRITGHDPFGLDPHIVEPKREGAGALHPGEGRAGQAFHPRGGGGQEHHHLSTRSGCVLSLHRSDHAAVAIKRKMAHPGERTAQPIPLPLGSRPQQQPLDPGIRLYWIGESGAAQTLTADVAGEPLTLQKGIA